jgi:SagB-type dehydrogenase family enzyme
MLAWLYHQTTSILRRRDLMPKDHQAHYLVSNLKLSATREPLFHSSSANLLPPPEPLNSSVPWAVGSSPVLATRLSLGNLSTLLAGMAGETGEGAERRRIAPTGGNLGSVRLWLLARKVEGLGRGVYFYDPVEHRLALRGSFDDSELREALGTHGELPPCVIVGAGDLAKCTQKYQGFAYRLIHFDAGVALAYGHVLSHGLGLLLREYADFDIQLPRIFGIPRRWEFPLPTFAIGVCVGSIPEEPFAASNMQSSPCESRLTPDDYVSDLVPRMLIATLDRPTPAPWRGSPVTPMISSAQPVIERLEEVLHLRRAVRKYSPTPPPKDVLQAIVTIASAIGTWRESAGFVPRLVHPILTVSEGSSELSPGIYELNQDSPTCFVRRSAFDRAYARECVNQLGLARSPVSLVAIANLRSALTRRSARGYTDSAVAAGAAVGIAWLAACSYGLVGTAAGGVIAHGFREVAAMDGFNACPLLSLHFGLPE